MAQSSGKKANWYKLPYASHVFFALIGFLIAFAFDLPSRVWNLYLENSQNRIITKEFRANIITDLKKDPEFKAIGEGISSIQKEFLNLNNYLASIDEKIRVLERETYRASARAAGIKHPDICIVTLTADEQFDYALKLPNRTINLRYTITSFDGESIAIRLDAEGDNGHQYRAVYFTIPATEGATINLSRLIPIPVRNMPNILFAVVGRPTPDSMVAAIGPAEKTPAG